MSMGMQLSPTGADGTTSFNCQNCGATTNVPAIDRTIRCPFCGSEYVLARPNDPNTPQPEALIAFSIAQPQAQEIYRNWIGTGFFKPRDLTQLATNHKMQGVFLPIWECSGNAHSEWWATAGYNRDRQEQYQEEENGQQVTKTRTITETDWHPAQGQHQGHYPRELVSGSRGLPQEWIDKLGDFDFGHLQAFNPQYLLGWESEECALDRTAALQVARQQIEREEQQACSALVPGNTHRDLRVQTQVHDLAGRLLFLPVWLASFQYKGTLYRCVVNGQTGKIGGDAPVSRAKVVFVVIASIAAVVAICLVIMLITRVTGGGAPTRTPVLPRRP
jgi:DNA-directed RNA polymerase subunit RPC12/RpoP